MERTTDLNEIVFGKKSNFTWGEAIAKHGIGEFAIGEDIGRGAESLDEALATCIAYKHDGINSHAAHYFMKMIKKESRIWQI